MNYYTNGDRVAVILTDVYGTGWWTDHQSLELLFLAPLAEAIDTNQLNLANKILQQLKQENPRLYHLPDAADLRVEWVDRHRKFTIDEYDGRETLWYKDEIKWIQC